jgi:hypothetical protein
MSFYAFGVSGSVGLMAGSRGGVKDLGGRVVPLCAT